VFSSIPRKALLDKISYPPDHLPRVQLETSRRFQQRHLRLFREQPEQPVECFLPARQGD
jgi:hypothetical protein